MSIVRALDTQQMPTGARLSQTRRVASGPPAQAASTEGRVLDRQTHAHAHAHTQLW